MPDKINVDLEKEDVIDAPQATLAATISKMSSAQTIVR